MRRIKLASLQSDVRDFFVSVRPDETPVIVERDGHPLAAVVPPWQVESWNENRRRLIDLLARLRDAGAGVPDNEIEADIEAALRDVRAG
ncbi:MAG: hypothetical protein HY744_30000 [Deltaproteobacteria bacterium]|nr:hypothetical protein [Deltaproteobacteria bacterium]